MAVTIFMSRFYVKEIAVGGKDSKFLG